MLTVRRHSKIFSPFFSVINFVNKVVSPRTRSARSRPEAFLLVRLRASRRFPSILWHQWLSKSFSWFSGVQYSCELKQYMTPNKRLKKNLLSTRQKTSCCPPCWIYDRERLGKINHMTKWRKRIQKVPDTKSSPSTLIQNSCVFKFFHSRERILKVPFSRIFLCGYVRCSVDGRPNRNNKVAFWVWADCGVEFSYLFISKLFIVITRPCYRKRLPYETRAEEKQTIIPQF